MSERKKNTLDRLTTLDTAEKKNMKKHEEAAIETTGTRGERKTSKVNRASVSCEMTSSELKSMQRKERKYFNTVCKRHCKEKKKTSHR